ncbi:hypothetical protein ACJMK2_014529 [Sinanodonta woodiana]|uniref:Presequence protease, mitochondrial n=1 Tax=Sinanodonta woodiana TaxID=1069815 RepID=A0ABD3V429_SINWO
MIPMSFILHRSNINRLWRVCQRSRSLAVKEAVKSLKHGDQVHGYTVEKVVEVPELFLTAVTLQHDKTGAKHFHVARDDSNNTFSVAFRTTPMDSTGVPHILEHTTLCGSRNFPVRDPFFKMLNRSLATYMNALTASDWTMYPFSSQNRRDYDNLLSIYLDAVFYPLLRELDFSQEGWRLEHEDPQKRETPIVFKGVVYNEMKGVFSSSQSLFAETVQNKLFPSHTYSVISGGDPHFIPDLTWSHLKNFHASHYHPSNSRFFTYGNFPLEDHLEFINSRYLQHFDRIQTNTTVPIEQRWSSPRSESITCQPDPMAPDPEKQTTVAVNFLMSEITDVFEAFTQSVICTLLVDGETSPFYQALLEANIGSDYAPVNGYNGYTKESSFSVGLQGIHPNDVEKVEKIIYDTIDKVIQEGFDSSRVAALLHRIELSQKHQSANFGLGIAMSIASCWNHDGDPSEMLKINQEVTLFKEKLKTDPQFLQKKVQQYLKDNPHRLTLKMSPDEKYEEKRQQREADKLRSFVNSLTEVDKEKIYERGLELLKIQTAEEDLSCLPTLRVAEIDRKIKPEPTEMISIHGVPLQYSAQPTNEVTYVKMMSDISKVPDELKKYIPLFSGVITKMGAGPYDYKQFSHEVERYTGGLGCGTHIGTDPNDCLALEQGLIFSSHCLERNTEKMFALWTEIFRSVDLTDSNRLTTLIKMTAADMAASLSHAGHSYAMTHCASHLSPASSLKEQFSGVTQVSLMKKIAESSDQSEVITNLQEISKYVMNKDNMRLSLNTTPSFMSSALSEVEEFVNSLPGSVSPYDIFSKLPGFEPKEVCTQIEFPFSVNYMSKAVQIVSYTHPDFPILCVLSRLLSWKYLHREIREKGGAYGGGASCTAGIFSFYSYRDPNSLQTLQTFDRSVEWAAAGKFTEEDVEEAKLSVFQQTDKPIAPGDVGMSKFVSSLTDPIRQVFRDTIFAVTRDDLVNITNRYLVPGQRPQASSFLGPANEQFVKDSKWKIIKG